MKRILFVSPTGGHAGIDVCLEELVLGLDRNRFSPVVVFPENALLKEKFEEEGILCYELPLIWWFPIGFSGSDILQVLPTLRDRVDPLVHIIEDNRIDLVVTNTSVAMDGAFAAAICGVPHIYFLHAQFVPNIYTSMQNESRDFLYTLMGKMSEKVVCCSKLLHDAFSRYIDNSCYIYNGVDTEKFAYKQREIEDDLKLNMICVGHFNQNKQQDFVIRALAYLKEKNPEMLSHIHFTMTGPGEKGYCDYLKKLINSYSLEDNVSMESYRDDISEYLGSFNLYINSSITENLPLSVLEAMSSGMPVLCTMNEGTAQLVSDGENGFLCETPEEMAEKMVWLLQNPDKFREMSAQSRKIVESTFSAKQYVSKFSDLFDSVLSTPVHLEKNAVFFNGLYESIVGESINKFPHKKILVIYPDAAMPTYILCVKIYFDILKEYKVLDYDAIQPIMYSDDMLSEYDAVLCVRFYDDLVYSILKKTIHRKKPFIWLIDDNYCGLRFENGVAIHEEWQNEQYERMFRDSTAVFVYSGGLYHFGRKLTNKIARLSNVQPDNRKLIENAERTDGKTVIGFMGTLLRDGDFEVVAPAIERVISKYGDSVRFEFIGYIPESLKDLPNVEHFEFISDYDDFRVFLAQRKWDIALAPLKQTLFNSAKTNNKYREYSSFGIAGIYSDVDAYYCVKHEWNGLLTENSADAWYEAMCRLIEDESLRKFISNNALEDVIHKYSPEAGAKEMMRAICRYGFPKSCVDEALEIGLDSRRSLAEVPLSFTGGIAKTKKYRISCRAAEFSKLGICFASFGEASGKITVSIFSEGIKLRECVVDMERYVHDNWTYMEFQPIENSAGQLFTVRLDFDYSPGSALVGVFEDATRRSFIYKVLNKLGLSPMTKDVLFADCR